MQVPIVYIIFNRLAQVRQTFEPIRKAKPEKLYLIADGARPEKPGEKEKVAAVRKYVEDNIDWDCMVIKEYSDQNMGCKDRIISGLNLVFAKEQCAVIIEDDVLMHNSFYGFCTELLNYYKEDKRVGVITGCNLCPEYAVTGDYFFTKINESSGWATWQRVWKQYKGEISDVELNAAKKTGILQKYFGEKFGSIIWKGIYDVNHRDLEAWDYQFSYQLAKKRMYCIMPTKNLVTNIGFGQADATHTTKVGKNIFVEGEIVLPIHFHSNHQVNKGFDEYYIHKFYDETLLQKLYSFVVSHYLDWKKDMEKRRKRGKLWKR